MTSPSLRTKRVVETPTLAVCGAIGFPISAPTELTVGISSGGGNNTRIATILLIEPDSASNGRPVTAASATTRSPATPSLALRQIVQDCSLADFICNVNAIRRHARDLSCCIGELRIQD